MAVIPLSKSKQGFEAPGIVGLMLAYPETARPLNLLADLMLAKESPTFSKGERELVASYVSWLNKCLFCSESHAAVADQHFGQLGYARNVWENPGHESVGMKLRSLLAIAAKVQANDKANPLTMADAERALSHGATERDIHDTVLIAAMFCMYNRYVDGLGTSAPPSGHESYLEMGRSLAERGYAQTVSGL